jgi:plastocyanin
VTGAKSDQVVPALPAGTYFFRCDVHPNMTGTIVVK